MSDQLPLPLPPPKILTRCKPFLIAFFKGEHRIPRELVALEYGINSGTADHVEVRLDGSIATHDFPKLTELVLLAHAHQLRAEIATRSNDDDGSDYRGLVLRLWDRAEAKGKWIPKHPSLDDLRKHIEAMIAEGGAA